MSCSPKPSVLLRIERIDDAIGARCWNPEESLSSREFQEYCYWRDPVRQRAYLASRLLLREMIGSHEEFTAFGFEPYRTDRFEILSRSPQQLQTGVRPRVLSDGVIAPVSVSISHTGTCLLVGLSPVEIPLGVDLLERQTLGQGFRHMWFTRQEQRHHEQSDNESETNELYLKGWAVKEATFKAASENRRFAPLEVEAFPVQKGKWRAMFAPRDAKTIETDRPSAVGHSMTVSVCTRGNHLLAATCDSGQDNPFARLTAFESPPIRPKTKQRENNTRREQPVNFRTGVGI